jgi:hypothetical protein
VRIGLATILFTIMMIIGSLTALSLSSGTAVRAKAYSCGYMRGMHFMAKIHDLPLRPLPYDCSEFDDLEGK